jgi:pantoate--beta-alanine ligase
LRSGEDVDSAMLAGTGMIMTAGFALDCFELRHAESLAPVTSIKDGPIRERTSNPLH